MARIKGSPNKQQSPPPITVTLTTDERITYLANLIIDRILEDQLKNRPLLRKVQEYRNE